MVIYSNYRHICPCILIASLLLTALSIQGNENITETSPNLIFIITDQQNFKTLGCYRRYLPKSLRDTWGFNNNMYTPNIDSLADNGTLFNKFYTVSPSCTPSRASFMTGKYPLKTGASTNHKPMKKTIETFASILAKHGYSTAYFGKWHLNGTEKPGFVEKGADNSFGFFNTKYMFNRGHWKFLGDSDSTVGKTVVWEYQQGFQKFSSSNEINKHYATDFLFDRAIEYIKKANQNGEKFAIVISIPDPHIPYDVRPPYNTMYGNKNFKLPYTAKKAWSRAYDVPPWLEERLPKKSATPLQDINDYENSKVWHSIMTKYYGMTKLIDDSVGKLIQALKNGGNDLYNDTIVAYTSDHGDMLMEHGVFDKNLPMESSAKVPFIIQYPRKIMKGKVIQKTYSSIDFAPTILSLMGIDWEEEGYKFDGSNATNDLLNSQKVVYGGQVRFVGGGFKAMINSRYKLIGSWTNNKRYFYDLLKDPFEMINFYNDTAYRKVIKAMEIIFDKKKGAYLSNLFGKGAKRGANK